MRFLSTVYAILLMSSNPIEAGIRIVVSVDWEGRSIETEDLKAMQSFRQDYAEIPLQHFLNAAYYTKAGADADAITAQIRTVVLPGDEEALHIHPWRTLTERAEVKFRTEPSFIAPIDLRRCNPDCGHDVNLAAYTEAELRKLIHTSVDILTENGFQRATSFRAGAWQARNKTFRALAKEGFTLDSSATYSEYLKEAWGDTPLYAEVGRIWPNIKPSSQPYRIKLGEGEDLIELPNNGCLADYMTGADILKVFRTNLALWKQNTDRDVYLSIGFHQETAKDYLNHLRQGIDAIRKLAQKENVPIEFIVPPFTIEGI